MPKRASQNSELTVALDSSSQEPLYRQLYSRLRLAILNGQLAAGFRLPSTRTLASQLGVSRNTVFNAYEQLLAEGYILGKVGSGTTVAPLLLTNHFSASPDTNFYDAPTPTFRLSAKAKNEPLIPDGLTQRGQILQTQLPFAGESPAQLQLNEPSKPRAFQANAPALANFPYKVWEQLLIKHIHSALPATASYQDPAGYLELRKALVSYLAVARGVRCNVEQVIITSGSQAALDLSARLLLEPGQAAWVEEPGYFGARAALLLAGAQLVPIPVDAEGLQVELGRQLAPQARLVAVTPSHQFPLGMTMSLNRRLALLEWARQAEAWILEDDYDSEYRFSGQPIPSLQSLDRANRVIYIGTFSKTVFPGLRLGYMVVPPQLVKSFVQTRRLIDGHTPVLYQLALTDFINEGHLGRHIRRMRELYAARATKLAQTLTAELGAELETPASTGGLYLVSLLRHSHNDQQLAEAARQHGVSVTALSKLYLHPDKTSRGGFLLGYAAFSNSEIEAGVQGLKKALAVI